MPSREIPEPVPPTPRAAPRETDASTRCPYCHSEVESGTLRSVCVGCGAVHHVACFAEHRGCATHGCGSSEASTLREASPALGRLSCEVCKQPVGEGELVAGCSCGCVMDVACFEAREGACGRAGCARPVKLVAQAQAHGMRLASQAQGERVGTLVLGLFSLLWTLGFAAVLVVGTLIGGPPPIGIGIVLVLLTALGAGGLSAARRRRRGLKRKLAAAHELSQRPPEPRRPAAPDPKQGGG